MRSLARMHAIWVFIILAFAISWIPWYTGGHGFFAWGPSLAGLIAALVVDGRKGILELLRRLVRWRVKGIWWALALLLPIALTALAVGVHVLMGGTPPSFAFLKQELSMLPMVVLILISPMGGAGGEEYLGWRNYAQGEMQKRWSPLGTSAAIGLFWALWHLPEFFNPSSTQSAAGLGFLLPMTLMWIAASVIMTWIYNHTQGSSLVAGVAFHLSLDLSSLTLLSDFTMQGMTEGIPPLDLRLVSSQIAAFVLFALLVIGRTGGKLGPANSSPRAG